MIHSALRRNLMKVWKTWTGPSQGGRACSRGSKSALSKILHNKEYFTNFETYLVVNLCLS